MAKKKKITTKRVQAMEDKPFVLPAVAVKPEIDDEPWGDDGLTTKQRLFVEALIGPAAGNATKAAQMAGYRDDNYSALAVTASENLKKPNVQEAIALAFARRRMTPEWASNRLMEIASASMRNFCTVDADGCLTVNWKLAAESGAIGQIREIHEHVIEAGGHADVIKRSFKLHDVVGALRTVLQLSGLLKKEPRTVKLVGADGGPVEVSHTFDNGRFTELYRRRTGRNQPGAEPVGSNGN
jgi:phage terminase small subunit